jgi:serine protease AprX
MAIEIPSSLVEFILLGPADDRRQLQDSPILGDVWVAFAREPDACLDLLITPLKTKAAGKVAGQIEDRFSTLELPRRAAKDEGPNIAYLQGIVAARLYFEELLRIVVPMTSWWEEKRTRDAQGEVTQNELMDYGPGEAGTKKIRDAVIAVFESAKEHLQKKRRTSGADKHQELMPLDRYIVLAGLILWAIDEKPKTRKTPGTDQKVDEIIRRVCDNPDAVLQRLNDLFEKVLSEEADVDADTVVWQISLNRTANPALAKSISAVKADAAQFLFKVNCSEITWAIIDSGIDGTHPAFGIPKSADVRVRKSFDFSMFRRIVSLSNRTKKSRKTNLEELLNLDGLLLTHPETPKAQADEFLQNAEKYLEELADDARRRGAVHWDLVEKFVEIHPKTPPLSNHGTHVAGIVGASKKAAEESPKSKRRDDLADGMCPDINLYDFRVIGPTIKQTEFAIIAVLQYIRYLNDRDNFFTIHGANLSLSIPHDVRNFACGRTPVCNECERLSDSGVVVVAAAGNHGYKSYQTQDGSYEGYTAFSVTDPGNADGVITVGATHRYWPHTYGVSFFSSRGPTGDGRLKPDLVAPGERIRAPLPNFDWGDLDGTSMAAPHVSGAAAMLLARYSELIGQPRRVKRILCDTATDLGRERTFQGHGMLDVLRAFQSI